MEAAQVQLIAKDTAQHAKKVGFMGFIKIMALHLLFMLIFAVVNLTIAIFATRARSNVSKIGLPTDKLVLLMKMFWVLFAIFIGGFIFLTLFGVVFTTFASIIEYLLIFIEFVQIGIFGYTAYLAFSMLKDISSSSSYKKGTQAAKDAYSQVRTIGIISVIMVVITLLYVFYAIHSLRKAGGIKGRIRAQASTTGKALQLAAPVAGPEAALAGQIITGIAEGNASEGGAALAQIAAGKTIPAPPAGAAPSKTQQFIEMGIPIAQGVVGGLK